MKSSSNLDLRAGVAMLAAAALLVALTLAAPDRFHLWEYAIGAAGAGAAAIMRFVTRPADGEPGPAFPVAQVLSMLGFDDGDSLAPELVKRDGWISVKDKTPAEGADVLVVISGSTVREFWTSELGESATAWRPLPKPPSS